MKNTIILLLFLGLLFINSCSEKRITEKWLINEHEYLETPGLSILSFHNFYPVGKQGGIEIIHHGERVATNGFIRLLSKDGEQLSQPEKADRTVDMASTEIISKVTYEEIDFKFEFEQIDKAEETPTLKFGYHLGHSLPGG